MNKCICGSEKFKSKMVDFHEVTAEGQTKKAFGKMTTVICDDCGIQRRQMSESAWSDFYKKYQPSSKAYIGKTYESDRSLASLRCDSYGLGFGGGLKILDVGSGSGAFVDECRGRGYNAFGCEVSDYAYAKNQDFVYSGQLEDIHFPTDHFDRVTCHDVLEHVIDPVKFLAEIFRTLKQGGECIVDFPNFEVEAGAHHWKEEHLWYFTTEQLVELLKSAGFQIGSVDHPIESKTVIYCSKPEQSRTSILLPPGIGDSYWSITKLQAFLERERLGLPDVYVACNRENRFSGHKRAFPFLEMFPFLNATGETFATSENKEIWKEAYAQEGRTIFQNVLGCDYFISYNGHLRVGKQMEELDPDLKTDWTPPMFVSLEQERFKKDCQGKYGKYIVFYFIFQGTYIYWLNQFGIAQLGQFIQQVARQTKATPVFVGAKWDAQESTLAQLKREVPNCIDLVGKTNVQQLFGLLRGSELVIGYPSGLSIISTVLDAKTLILWNKFYDRDFAWYACPPKTRNKTYFIEDTENLEVLPLVKMAVDIFKDGKPSSKPRSFLSVPRLPSSGKKRIIKNPVTPQAKITTPEKASLITNKNTLTVACVLRSGGEYTAQYVEAMKNMVARNLSIPHKFVCFSDINVENRKPLEYGFPGWWSKLELFKIKGPVLYFDLDTVILGNIDRLAKAVMEMPENTMKMLTPFNPKRREAGEWASGIMAWHGDFRFLLDEAPRDLRDRFFSGWDQVYIFRSLLNKKVPIDAINKSAAICSYKRHCWEGKPPVGSEVVCFHGNSRPKTSPEKWVKDNWR